MARRFGRNQRRHMREQIAGLEQSIIDQQDSTRRVQQEAALLRRRLEDWAEEILHLMGEDSAFNEQLHRIRTRGGLDRLMLSPVPAPITARDRSPQWEKVSDVITACILRCRIKADDLRGHVAVEIGDHMGPLVGYALSEARREKWTPRDIRQIAGMIANEMAAQLLRETEGERRRA